jgi:hypothetical protein
MQHIIFVKTFLQTGSRVAGKGALFRDFFGLISLLIKLKKSSGAGLQIMKYQAVFCRVSRS